MKKKSEKKLLRSLLVPILSVVVVLAVVIVSVQGVFFYQNTHNRIMQDSLAENHLIAENVSIFISEAYSLSENLAQNPTILTMQTDQQTPVLENCVANNPYLELLYVQGADGMQTGRSSGELADRSERWWFKQVTEEKKAFVSKSYYSVNTGMPCASVFFPMYAGDTFTGVFATDIKLDSLVTLVSEMSDTKKDKMVFIIDGEGTVVAHPDKKYIEELYNYKNHTKTVSVKDGTGKVQTNEDGSIVTEEKEITISDSFAKMINEVMSGKSDNAMVKMDGDSYYAAYSPIVMDGESDAWSVVTIQKKNTLFSPLYTVLGITILVAFLALLLSAFIVRNITRRITDPVTKLTSAIGAASEGDFSVRAEGSGAEEIVLLADSFNQMTEKISRILHETLSLINNVKGSSETLSGISEQSEMAAAEMADISSGAASQLDDTKKALELTEDLGKISGKLMEMNRILSEATEETKTFSSMGMESVDELRKKSQESLEAVQLSFEKVLNLNESSRQIGTIIQEINEISSQTSLLALNASIEAARAGEHGRGFAVVAEQVSALAANSESATKNIDDIISGFQEEIESIVSEIESIKEIFGSQIESVGAVESSFACFKTASEETLDVVGQVGELIDRSDALNHQIISSIDDIFDISKKTEEEAQKVSGQIKQQKDDIYEIANKVDSINYASEMLENEMSMLTIQDVKEVKERAKE